MKINVTDNERRYFENILAGTSILADGYIIQDDQLWFTEPTGLKPVWNGAEWVESATEEEVAEHTKKLSEEEYKKQLPLTVFDMDNRLYMTQEMIDTLLFEMMSMQTFAMTTMTIEKQEEYMTTQAFYYYDRIIQKEKREGLQSATNYYNLVVSKFPQYKEDIDFLLIENDKEYIIG